VRVPLLASLAAAALLALLGPPAHTQPPRRHPVYFGPGVLEALQADWDQEATFAAQPERGYCLVAERRALPRGDTAWVVVNAVRSVPLADSPESVWFECGAGVPTLHTHPPTTCEHAGALIDPATCRFGGPMAGIFWPSIPDRLYLLRTGAPFLLIQFDRRGVSVVYPPALP
jgi:hypothetical protein